MIVPKTTTAMGSRIARVLMLLLPLNFPTNSPCEYRSEPGVGRMDAGLADSSYFLAATKRRDALMTKDGGPYDSEEPSMQTITAIGLDIAKSVFQVHGVDADGQVVVRRQLKRRYVLAFFQKLPPCLVGIEACASAHHWARELQALGHTAKLMPPAYVKPYVKRHKNDAADAEAICEAVTRPNMRFVATKTPEQQSCLTLHRTRHLFIRQQTSVINAIRAHLAEFGIVAPVGRQGVDKLLDIVADSNDRRLPEIARACVAALGAQLRVLKVQILEFDRMIRAWHRSSEASKRLDQVPGVGPVLATALVASVADPRAFRSGRDFSAWIGLVPKQNSSGGKDKLGSISKQGDRYLRSLFTTGALAVIR